MCIKTCTIHMYVYLHKKSKYNRPGNIVIYFRARLRLISDSVFVWSREEGKINRGGERVKKKLVLVWNFLFFFGLFWRERTNENGRANAGVRWKIMKFEGNRTGKNDTIIKRRKVKANRASKCLGYAFPLFPLIKTD